MIWKRGKAWNLHSTALLIIDGLEREIREEIALILMLRSLDSSVFEI